jgi:hypothetical protein
MMFLLNVLMGNMGEQIASFAIQDIIVFTVQRIHALLEDTIHYPCNQEFRHA